MENTKQTTVEQKKTETLPEVEKKKDVEGLETINPGLVKSLLEEIASLKKGQEMLLKIADKKALSRYFQSSKPDSTRVVGIKEIDGKVVVGSKLLTNDVHKDMSNKTWHENQTVSVIYEDGTSEEMPVASFYSRYSLVECKRNGIVRNEETGQEAFKLTRLDNGKEYTIAVEFVN